MTGRAVSPPLDSTFFFFLINHGSVQADYSIIQSWLYADCVRQPQMITIKFCFFVCLFFPPAVDQTVH